MSTFALDGGIQVVIGGLGPPGPIAADFIISAPGPQPVGSTGAPEEWPFKIGHGFTVQRVGGDAIQASTGTVVINVYKSGVLSSTVTYSGGNPIPAITGIGEVIEDGDRIDVVWPNTRDATLTGVTFYFGTL